ncbi:Gfo/Idh/MocA family oxidoreductase [Vallicoccus soli]|uniref:Gfo/Idh/MocA family oxidoreductase n=1 Tax=Vallicoccus soli TaxID=2339232 RepID=A0A3A3ZL94_9ACTN|nr:Gfo/Idh/MocA family oxidoreductase [Vallicoccus soli]RJK96936.1 gfo/Idh/MocA family oxidoreductase [Vallicoccus soli]
MGTGALRVGLAGYGSAGRTIHGPLLTAVGGLEVAVVVTSDAARAAAAREEHPGCAVVASYADLLARAGELDLVVLATPNAGHVEQARAALEAGLAVVVDKPLALDAASARSLVAAGGPLTVFQNRRWDPVHTTLRRVLAEGALGEAVRHEARYERWRPQPKDRWREGLTSEQGGGLLLDLQSHLVDGALDLFGPVEQVFAELASVTTVGDDVAFLALRHASGVRSHLGATSLAGAPGPRVRVLGRGGTYVAGPIDNDVTTLAPTWTDDAPDQRGWLVRGDEREPVRAEPARWEEFYEAVVRWVRGEGPAPVDPADAVATLEVLDAARRSAREGVVVPIRHSS